MMGHGRRRALHHLRYQLHSAVLKAVPNVQQFINVVNLSLIHAQLDKAVNKSIVVPDVQNALYFRRKVRALYYVNALHVFTALHGMQTRSSDENSVCLSVRHTRGL